MRPALLLVFLLFVMDTSAQRRGARRAAGDSWESMIDKPANDSLKKLRERIQQGDLDALYALGYYLNNKTNVADTSGQHCHTREESLIARMIIQENSLLIAEELKIDSTLTSEKFHSFLSTNKDRLIYSAEASGFLITPFEKRKTKYKLREMGSVELEGRYSQEYPYPEWVVESNIELYIKTHNPLCLVLIASEHLSRRTKSDTYSSDNVDCIEYLKYLTHLEVGIPGDQGKISFLYQHSTPEMRMNLLTYFATHVNDYTWSETENRFINTAEEAKSKTKEEQLFALLNSDDYYTPIDAYLQLLESDPEKVKELSDLYDSNNIDYSSNLPPFCYKSIKQVSILTAWCRKNGINYKASAELETSLDSLETKVISLGTELDVIEVPYTVRYSLENRIIRELTADQVIMVEFYGLSHDISNDKIYSFGRILDKFYSKNWSTIVSNEKYLLEYLKKAQLFKQLGAEGICNKYLLKFENCPSSVLSTLQQLKNQTDDKDILSAITVVLEKYSTATVKPLPTIRKYEKTNDHTVKEVTDSYRKILRSDKHRMDKGKEIQALFRKISYAQLGEALKLMKTDTLLAVYEKYDILDSDFGFIINDYWDSIAIEKFRLDYKRLSEREMYRRNLTENGIDIFTPTGKLDYNKVYEFLRYDNVEAFVSGDGPRPYGVYGTIKLLEFQFNTRLGFPAKSCYYQGSWGCGCTQQSLYWQKFLIDKNLITINPAEPRSISYDE